MSNLSNNYSVSMAKQDLAAASSSLTLAGGDCFRTTSAATSSAAILLLVGSSTEIVDNMNSLPNGCNAVWDQLWVR